MGALVNRQVVEKVLIHFSIIHSQADMGGLGESVRQAAQQNLGEETLMKKVALVDQLWTDIGNTIDAMHLSYENVRLYQDGLPVCGRETDIVRQTALKGSQNYQLLLRLMENGATIVGTESPALLVREYELMRKTLEDRDNRSAIRSRARLKTMSDSLIKQRDQVIARRIHETLGKGETGILFIGALHSVENYLSRDIRIIYPMRQPVDKR